MELEPLYRIQVNCPCCGSTFSTSRVRQSFKRALRTDTDFCGHYREGANPDYYVVRVCPICGYASTENSMAQLSNRQKEAYYNEVGKRWTSRDYGGERNNAQALDSYKLALMTCQAVGESDRLIAGILHHLAWLYRETGQEEQERKFLRFALDAYVQVYEEGEHTSSDARLMYLIGELNRRVGERNEAVRWFTRVIHDERIVDSAMIRACREQWQLIREEMHEEGALSNG
ncbi:DUF2225 domain-containing protein [Paenibacillus protaetiae]|uniref:DUF2225 domain-containing protein n=1 Tax=Paenibacillus protaetiae TaxID=2509456 RepID=A0A4P6F8L2_9BACL|nr:DUF2225 domain-containing protein [Paenibacillus protaetiae]QAY66788.1 DUF2225 domain-containing protein [Paenibacillus protaetiae]